MCQGKSSEQGSHCRWKFQYGKVQLLCDLLWSFSHFGTIGLQGNRAHMGPSSAMPDKTQLSSGLLYLTYNQWREQNKKNSSLAIRARSVPQKERLVNFGNQIKYLVLVFR